MIVIGNKKGSIYHMGFEVIDDITFADIAFRIYGQDINELFASAAQAVISAMIENPESISMGIEKNIELQDNEPDALLFNFLQEFIFYKDSESLLLLPDSIKIIDTENIYKLKSVIYGETINNEKHDLLVDVKAVTMHKLDLRNKDGVWTATLVLDV